MTLHHIGDCYPAAFEYLLSRRKENRLRLVHAEVKGTGQYEGTTFGHAWVEDGDTVIDRSNWRDIQMPRREYYDITGVAGLSNKHVYTFVQAMRWYLRSRHCGPWDLEMER